jgi:hypothetical protein
MSDETPSQSIQEQIEALERYLVAFEEGLTDEQKTDPKMVHEIERAKATLQLLKQLRLMKLGNGPRRTGTRRVKEGTAWEGRDIRSIERVLSFRFCRAN